MRKTLLSIIFALSVAVAAVAAVSGRSAYAAFPVGQARSVVFSVDDDEISTLTERERTDQYRDWLLFTAVQAGGLTPAELNRVTYDRPAVRAGFMRVAGNLEYGDTRSLYTGNGTVVALVPEGLDPAHRQARLGEIADRHRASAGAVPLRLEVFEYALGPGAARITRTAAVDGTALYTAQGRYHEARVTTPAELETFLRTVNDLTAARMDEGALVLGGRMLPDGPAQPLSVEDVAALWGSQREMEGSGFSLDPAWDGPALAELFTGAGAPMLERLTTPGQRDGIMDALRGGQVDRYLAWADSLRRNGAPETAMFLSRVAREYRFQTARYDGALRGTHVGMVLFYTDLLAKLWGWDYASSTPMAAIPGFEPKTRVPLSPIYRAELDSLNETRLWFGPRDSGFQAGPDGRSLFFAHLATDVYAASASEYTPGVEAPANALSAGFIDWWNDHYDEIAAYEPQYQTLNQIMKWSLLVGWLDQAGNGDPLSFLDGLPVDTTAWFPEWARRQSGLRFTRWDSVGFYARGYHGMATEALPTLTSIPFALDTLDLSHFTGGVSLGGRETFAERAALSLETSPEMRRPGLDYRRVDEASGEFTVRDGGVYRLAREGVDERTAKLLVTRPGSVRFRGALSEVAHADVERVVERDGARLSLRTLSGGTPVGDVEIAPVADGFEVAWHGRDLTRALSLARTISANPRADGLLLADRWVESAYRVGDAYVVKLEGGARWVKIYPESTPSVALQADARAADYRGSPRLLRWLSKEAAQAELKEPHVTIKDPPGGNRPPGPGEAPGSPDGSGPRGRGTTGTGPIESADRALLLLTRRRNAFEAADAHLAAREYAAALDALAAPELADDAEAILRRALADLSLVRSERAEFELNRLRGMRRDDQDRVYEQIRQLNAALPREGTSLSAIARFARWVHSDAASAGRMNLRVRHGVVSLEYGLPAPLHLEAASVGDAARELREGRAMLYVQDSPGLNNHDFSASAVGETLNELIVGRRGRLHELPGGGLEDFRPSLAYEQTDPGATYRLRTPNDAHPDAAAEPNLVAVPAVLDGRCDDGREARRPGEPRRTRRCPRVFVVVVRG